MTSLSNIAEYCEETSSKEYTYLNLSKLNPYIECDADEDILYHITLGNKSHDLPKMFGDVKFIVLGGTPKQMEQFAYFIMKEIGYELPPGTVLNDISHSSHRYAMFKVGPILSVSHGMGRPSIGIVLNELIKLVYHARIKDPIFIRFGSSEGFGQPEGTIVITNKVFNEYLESTYEMYILGNKMKFSAELDQNLINELESFSRKFQWKTVVGATYCSNDFYEGSGRLDGAICEYTEEGRAKFFKFLQNLGIVNTEMESTAFTALTRRAGIKSAVVTVVVHDKMAENRHVHQPEIFDQCQLRLFKFVSAFIGHCLSLTKLPETMRNMAAAARQDPIRPSLIEPVDKKSSSTVLQTPQCIPSLYQKLAWSDSGRRTSMPKTNTSESEGYYEGVNLLKIVNASVLENTTPKIISVATRSINQSNSQSDTESTICPNCGTQVLANSTESLNNSSFSSVDSICSHCGFVFELELLTTPQQVDKYLTKIQKSKPCAFSSNFQHTHIGRMQFLSQSISVQSGGSEKESNKNYMARTHSVPSPSVSHSDSDKSNQLTKKSELTPGITHLSRSLSNAIPEKKQKYGLSEMNTGTTCPSCCQRYTGVADEHSSPSSSSVSCNSSCSAGVSQKIPTTSIGSSSPPTSVIGTDISSGKGKKMCNDQTLSSDFTTTKITTTKASTIEVPSTRISCPSFCQKFQKESSSSHSHSSSGAGSSSPSSGSYLCRPCPDTQPAKYKTSGLLHKSTSGVLEYCTPKNKSISDTSTPNHQPVDFCKRNKLEERSSIPSHNELKHDQNQQSSKSGNCQLKCLSEHNKISQTSGVKSELKHNQSQHKQSSTSSRSCQSECLSHTSNSTESSAAIKSEIQHNICSPNKEQIDYELQEAELNTPVRCKELKCGSPIEESDLLKAKFGHYCASHSDIKKSEDVHINSKYKKQDKIDIQEKHQTETSSSPLSCSGSGIPTCNASKLKSNLSEDTSSTSTSTAASSQSRKSTAVNADRSRCVIPGCDTSKSENKELLTKTKSISTTSSHSEKECTLDTTHSEGKYDKVKQQHTSSITESKQICSKSNTSEHKVESKTCGQLHLGSDVKVATQTPIQGQVTSSTKCGGQCAGKSTLDSYAKNPCCPSTAGSSRNTSFHSMKQQMHEKPMSSKSSATASVKNSDYNPCCPMATGSRGSAGSDSTIKQQIDQKPICGKSNIAASAENLDPRSSESSQGYTSCGVPCSGSGTKVVTETATQGLETKEMSSKGTPVGSTKYRGHCAAKVPGSSTSIGSSTGCGQPCSKAMSSKETRTGSVKPEDHYTVKTGSPTSLESRKKASCVPCLKSHVKVTTETPTQQQLKKAQSFEEMPATSTNAGGHTTSSGSNDINYCKFKPVSNVNPANFGQPKMSTCSNSSSCGAHGITKTPVQASMKQKTSSKEKSTSETKCIESCVKKCNSASITTKTPDETLMKQSTSSNGKSVTKATCAAPCSGKPISHSAAAIPSSDCKSECKKLSLPPGTMSLTKSKSDITKFPGTITLPKCTIMPESKAETSSKGTPVGNLADSKSDSVPSKCNMRDDTNKASATHVTASKEASARTLHSCPPEQAGSISSAESKSSSTKSTADIPSSLKSKRMPKTSSGSSPCKGRTMSEGSSVTSHLEKKDYTHKRQNEEMTTKTPCKDSQSHFKGTSSPLCCEYHRDMMEKSKSTVNRDTIVSEESCPCCSSCPSRPPFQSHFKISSDLAKSSTSPDSYNASEECLKSHMKTSPDLTKSSTFSLTPRKTNEVIDNDTFTPTRSSQCKKCTKEYASGSSVDSQQEIINCPHKLKRRKDD